MTLYLEIGFKKTNKFIFKYVFGCKPSVFDVITVHAKPSKK